ncbi:Antibiotic biosynthesis monooxygenase [Streptomyces zinciresistens K42]|uniref:Antibiotic biosynthesis monooxygenase n=1 Tax=Streptomyces zinciresistens K42 TaxID=700597 RepID=G2GGS3_9ACTN|nr:antibiotic biosynthesis monooxygenase family protein [Streptomyces zinciresistens]EGX57269.1 Antibiotic biosynthesis monooxygenase [Streptomyces zinciresistens K42]
MAQQDTPQPQVTFVNRFTVSGSPQEFEDAFARIAAFMTEQPGIIGYTLSQDVKDPQRYVNIARWEQANALRAAVAHPDFQSHVKELRQLAQSESELYTERHRYLDRTA